MGVEVYLQPGTGHMSGCVKTSSRLGAYFGAYTPIHFQRHFKVPILGPILKTVLIYYFLTDYHLIFQMIKQENLKTLTGS